jgi:hypothetical protein
MSIWMKTNYAAIGLWVLAILVIFIFPHFLPVLTGFGNLFFPFLGMILMAFSFIVLLRQKNKFQPVFAILMVAVISLAVLKKGVSWGATAHFYINKNRYETVVAKVLSARDDAEREKICGDDCWLLSDTPTRIAFHYAHGFLNWHDIVYDPTGAVKTQDIDQKHQISIYFRGAELLEGNWYLGHFAD